MVYVLCILMVSLGIFFMFVAMKEEKIPQSLLDQTWIEKVDASNGVKIKLRVLDAIPIDKHLYTRCYLLEITEMKLPEKLNEYHNKVVGLAETTAQAIVTARVDWNEKTQWQIYTPVNVDLKSLLKKLHFIATVSLASIHDADWSEYNYCLTIKD